MIIRLAAGFIARRGSGPCRPAWCASIEGSRSPDRLGGPERRRRVGTSDRGDHLLRAPRRLRCEIARVKRLCANRQPEGFGLR